MFKKKDLLKYKKAICQKNYVSEGSSACQFLIQSKMSVAEVFWNKGIVCYITLVKQASNLCTCLCKK